MALLILQRLRPTRSQFATGTHRLLSLSLPQESPSLRVPGSSTMPDQEPGETEPKKPRKPVILTHPARVLLSNRGELLRVLNTDVNPPKLRTQSQKPQAEQTPLSLLLRYSTTPKPIKQRHPDPLGWKKEVAPLFTQIEQILVGIHTDSVNLSKEQQSKVANILLSRLLRLCADLGDMESVATYAEKFWQIFVQAPYLQAATYPSNMLVKIYCEKGDLAKAYRVVDQMKGANIPISNTTFNPIVEATRGKPQEALSVVNRIMGNSINPTTSNYNRIFQTLGGSPSHANQFSTLFRLMLSQGVKPNTETALTILWNNKSPDVAEYLLADVSSWNLPLNETLLGEMIKYYQASGNLDKIFLLVDRFKRKNVTLGAGIYSELLRTCAIHDRVEAATNVLLEMKRLHLQPSTRAYRSVFRMIDAHPEYKRSLLTLVYDHLQMRDVPISQDLLLDVVKCFAGRKDVVVIFDLFNRICQRTRYLDPREEAKKKAGDFLDRILFQKILPMDPSVAKAFLDGFLRNGRHEIALEILSSMSDRKHFAQPPDEDLICLFLDSITELKHLKYLEKILHSLVKHKINPTKKTKTSLQTMYTRLREKQGAKPQGEFSSPEHPISLLLKGLSHQIERLSLGDPLEGYVTQIAEMGQMK